MKTNLPFLLTMLMGICHYLCPPSSTLSVSLNPSNSSQTTSKSPPPYESASHSDVNAGFHELQHRRPTKAPQDKILASSHVIVQPRPGSESMYISQLIVRRKPKQPILRLRGAPRSMTLLVVNIPEWHSMNGTTVDQEIANKFQFHRRDVVVGGALPYIRKWIKGVIKS